MITRILAAVVVFASGLALAGGPALAREVARIVYLGVEGDPYYEPQPVYTGLSLRDRERPLSGARLAMRDTRVLGRALDLSFELEEILLAPGEPPATAIRDARMGGALAVLIDLPAEQMAAAVESEGGEGLLLNIRDRDARWRARDCAPSLLHTIPSNAMLSDALAQHLRAQNWTSILLLHGNSDQDVVAANAARRSIAKFGLGLVADRAFELSNDPRHRDQNNIALLTSGPRHDVIWLVDSVGEFGRYVPYATQLPRPVVGSEGLMPLAWHWTWERNGAPQLNQRFRREAGRDMASEDWAAWVATRAVIEAVTRLGAADPAEVAEYVRSDALAVDLYKGARGSFRPWNGQLRQPILLATHNAVITTAPVDGFQHQTDTLDTLGMDEQESRCEM